MGRIKWREYQEQIVREINELEPELISQLLWVSVVRNIPNFLVSIKFRYSKKHIRSYMNLLGISLGITYASIFHVGKKNKIEDHDIRAANEVISALMIAPDDSYLSRHAGLFIAAIIRARNLYVINENEAFKNISTKDVAVMLARYSNHEQFLDSIKTIRAKKWNDFDGKVFFEKNNKNGWELFRKRMYDLKLGYWMRCFEELLANHLIPKKEWLMQIVSVPPELLIDGDTDTLIKWLDALENQGAQHLNEARIILLGEKGAGKTSLARRLINPKAKMPEERESTEGVDVTSFKLRNICHDISEDDNANVHIWDFAGHSITHAAHRCFLSERCIYIILYDGRTEGRNRLSYWLNHVRDYGGDSKLYVLANVKDDNKPDIEENYIKKHYSRHDCEFSYFSIRDDADDLEAFRIEIAKHISNDPAWGQNMPVNYFNTKETLKSTFGDNRDFITFDDFKRIAPDGDSEMLKALHSLGICLYYEDIAELNTLVLNPKWITWGIYHIINWLKNIQEHYQLTIADFVDIFADSINRYPESRHHFLYRLMIKYELAYEDIKKNILIVPQCLDNDQPTEEAFPDFPMGQRLCTRFDAKQKDDNTPMPFPPDIMPRIIVKRFTEALHDLAKVWRYGAILYHSDDTFAFIQQKDSVILLQVAGAERLKYHDMLRGTILDTIHTYTSFQENEPEIKYELVEHPDTMYPEKSLKNLAFKGLKTFEDLGLDKTINVQENTKQYTIIVDNRIINVSGGSSVISGATGTTESMDTNVTYNFQYCNIIMKNRLEELGELLETSGNVESKILKNAAEMLRQADEKECKKNTRIRRALQKIKDQLVDEKSGLHKAAKVLINGGKLIADLLGAYSQFAKQCGWQ